MPCPFGFAAEDEEDEELLSEEEASDKEAADGSKDKVKAKKEKKKEDGSEADTEAEAKGTEAEEDAKSTGKKGKKKKSEDSKKSDKDRFNPELDPVSWFYSNQIKSEEEFQAKKDLLREEAKRRLDAIMNKKNKSLIWPSDSEFDDLSISSGELSELDSDTHSLSSVISCANSWIEDAQYKTPAETTLKYACGAGIAISMHCMFMCYHAMSLSRKAMGVISHNNWPTYTFLAGVAASSAIGLSLMTALWRSKRMLLASQIALALAYGATLLMACLLHFQPTVIDPKLRDAACSRWARNEAGMNRLCRSLPTLETQLASTMGQLFWSLLASAAAVLVTAGLNMWYIFELCFIEKKAIKHQRRHKRRKQTIPWHKIKVVGPVTNCGAPGGGPAAGAGAGKCPVAH